MRARVRETGQKEWRYVHELPPVEAQRVQPATLEVRDLTVRFGGVMAVTNVSFAVHPGEVVGLIGPNGAGKTTIINAITGFVRPTAGSILLDDVAIESWGPSVARRYAARSAARAVRRHDWLR
jgi:sulfate-transporting ATPase